jgi:LPXTG-site transpeptidase (sortase) family protein
VLRSVSGTRDAADEEDRPKADPDPLHRLPLVRTLEGMRQYGDPPGAGFARLRIPSQGVNATGGARTVGQDGAMHAPSGPADVVWYDLSGWGLGGTPGGGGNAVFSAHVDYADIVPFANVRYQGVGVFFNISRLQQGDIIEIDYRGQALRYAVESRRQFDEGGDWGSILAPSGERDSITLITCSGDFDISTRSYASRTVVRAVRL